jgi:zinc transport system substrate-binding protein
MMQIGRWAIAMIAAIWGSQAAVADDVKVIATIKPIHSLVTGVMQGIGTPRLLIDGTGSPHTFSLKPSDARALSAADVVFRVSEGLEPFSIRLAKALPSSVRLITLEDIPGLTLHPLRVAAAFDADPASPKPESHSHDLTHAVRHDHGEGADGHIWLDPANARLIVMAIAGALAEARPEHAAAFHENAARLVTRLDALTGDLASALEPLKGRPYIVFHDAYQYLEQRYGLAPIGSVTISPDVPPSAKRLTTLRQKLAQQKVACVFAEPQFEPKLIETIIEGTSARRATLDPLGVAIAAGPDQYFLMMLGLARDFRGCLADPA